MAPPTKRHYKVVDRFAHPPATVIGIRSEQLTEEKLSVALLYYKVFIRSRPATINQLIGTFEQKSWEFDKVEEKAVKAWFMEDNIGTAEELDGYIKQARNGGPRSWAPCRRTAYGTKCMVCNDMLADEGFPFRNPMTKCRHECKVCHNCLQITTDNQIYSFPTRPIQCPACPVALSAAKIKTYASADAYARYLHFPDILRHPGYTDCTANDCGSGQIHKEGYLQPIMTCEICEFKTCYNHQQPWHEGESCWEYDMRIGRHMGGVDDDDDDEQVRENLDVAED